ncbi:MAG: 3-deoxy-8-phosphooctulonate synthase, partial [Candidatus Omnitrophica bacterium]|nr:3-deoxy-8-phosphooctulonate synthase [Candidatus Omnitrophota bacterium]
MNKKKLIVIAGPCVIESRSLTLEIAGCLKEILKSYPVEFIFKASFDKANRTSLDS